MPNDGRKPRRRHYDEDPASRGFGLGWTVFVPPEWDRADDHILVRLYADPPSDTADGWEALWFKRGTRQAHDSYRHVDRDTVLEWVRATHVHNVLLEDAATRQFSILR